MSFIDLPDEIISIIITKTHDVVLNCSLFEMKNFTHVCKRTRTLAHKLGSALRLGGKKPERRINMTDLLTALNNEPVKLSTIAYAFPSNYVIPEPKEITVDSLQSLITKSIENSDPTTCAMLIGSEDFIEMESLTFIDTTFRNLTHSKVRIEYVETLKIIYTHYLKRIIESEDYCPYTIQYYRTRYPQIDPNIGPAFELAYGYIN